MAARLITLRYPGGCIGCERPLAAGAEAWWEGSAKTVTCVDCHDPADPFVDKGPRLVGTAGGAAQEKADRLAAAGRSQRTIDDWEKGADGERRLAQYLADASQRGEFRLLHDRRIPGSRANIDHLAVAATGIYVIDAKNYHGKVELEVTGVARWRQERLRVNGRNLTHLANNMARQVEAVKAALGQDADRFGVPVTPALCFVDSEWELFFSAFTVNGVLVTALRPLRRTLRKKGPLGVSQRTELAALLAERLPPAVAPPAIRHA